MTTPSFERSPPFEDRITSYDERHFVTYLRLLDADAEGAAWTEAVQIVFGVDPEEDPDSARALHQAHLERARWMTKHGYRHLLEMSRKQ